MSDTPLLTAAKDAVKLIVGFASTPGGLALATSILGAANPAVLLVEQFGIRILGPLVATWTADTITDADVAANLASKGLKVVPFDPLAAFK